MANDDIQLDDIDLKILGHVQANGRDGLAEIGAVAGLSVSAVNERLKRLQQSGVILGWEARVSPAAVGCDVLAFMFVVVPHEGESAFRKWIAASPEVMECHHVTGDWSYVLKLRVASLQALDTFLEATKARKVIDKSHSMLSLRSVKETARLPVRAANAPDRKVRGQTPISG